MLPLSILHQVRQMRCVQTYAGENTCKVQPFWNKTCNCWAQCPPSCQHDKLRWFVYMEECVHPEGVFQYIGSTTSMTERWSNTKSKINGNKTPGTGLETHFAEGCSQNLGPDLASVRVTLLEHMDTNHGRLTNQAQAAGAQNVENLKL